jgi:nucleoside 2-deoxyribosyltransferase
MSSAPSGRKPSNIEITLFGFLVSLSLKGGLDTAYSHSVTNATSWPEFMQAIWIAPSFLLFIFLITLLRFIYGAYRFHEEAQQSSTKLGLKAQLWSIGATLVLFVLFYVTGLSIQHAKSFFLSLMLIHAWDFIWFTSMLVLAKSLKRVAWTFILLDLLTILIIFVLIYLLPEPHRNIAAGMMLFLAAADLFFNREFFFQPEEWRKQNSQTSVIKPPTSERKRIYFAAPLFTQGEWQWNLLLTEKLRGLGFDVVLPQDRAKPMLYGTEGFDPKVLFEENKKEIDGAKVVLAILDQPDPDSGTCWECGYAFKAGLPVVGLRTDIRSAGDDPEAGVNLMLSQSCKKLLTVPLDKRDDLTWVAQQLAELINQV